jgi:hypothetical protein
LVVVAAKNKIGGQSTKNYWLIPEEFRYTDGNSRDCFKRNFIITLITPADRNVEYNITWQNEDGTTIDTTKVKYGVTPTHEAPKKASDENYDYTFKGWTPTVVAATKDATYKAQYDKKLRTSEYPLYNFLQIGTRNYNFYRLKKTEDHRV